MNDNSEFHIQEMLSSPRNSKSSKIKFWNNLSKDNLDQRYFSSRNIQPQDQLKSAKCLQLLNLTNDFVRKYSACLPS